MQSIMKDYPNIILSKYEVAELEEFIYQNVTNTVDDPVLNHSLSSLQWLQKRMQISYIYSDDIGTHSDELSTIENRQKKAPIVSIQMDLRLPSLLYPKLEEWKRRIEEMIDDQTQKWMTEKQKISFDSSTQPFIRTVLQVLPPTKPIPVMARFVEDSDVLLKDLGPGLASVAHFVAVYSCKVSGYSSFAKWLENLCFISR